jgi:MFS family permease
MKEEREFFGLSKNVFVTGLVSFLMDASSEMIYPLVPLFLASVLGINKSVIGLIEGIAESTASLLKVFSGWYSDRLGRRKHLMALGYGISALSRPIMATAGSWPHVLIARFVDRTGKGVRTAPRDAIIAEASKTTHLGRAFGFHRSMDTFGAVVGPALALLCLYFLPGDYRAVFWLSLLPALLAVVTIIIFIKEKGRDHSRASQRPGPAISRFDWNVEFFVIIAAVFAIGNSSDVFLILRAGQIGIPTAMIPAVYLMFNLVYSLCGVPAGIAADKFGRRRLILLGFALFFFVYLGFANASRVGHIWLLFALYGVYMGITEGVQKAFLASIIPAESKATAFGVYATAIGLATLPASLIAGLLWDRVSPAAPFYFGAAVAALSFFLFLSLVIAENSRR